MDQKARLSGRNAPPPTAGAPPCINEKDGKRSMLQSFKNFRRSCLPHLILGSQVKVFSRFKDLKTVTKTVNGMKDGGQITSSLAPPLLPAPNSTPTSRLEDLHQRPELDSRPLNSIDTEVKQPMHPPLVVIASQKRKQLQEHDDAPSRTKSKSRPVPNNTERRHLVQEWVDRQGDSASPPATQPDPGADNSSTIGPPPLTPPPMPAEQDGFPIADPRRHSLATTPGLNSEMVDSIFHHRSNAKRQSQPQAVTPTPQPLRDPERRGSTATTTNVTYRDSIFSSCPSVATGLTSPSEVSLSFNPGRRVYADSRSSSFMCKTSPRSSIASNAPSPNFFLYRTLSSNSAGQLEEMYELVKHTLPNVPKIDPLRSHPIQTFLGMDLENSQTAVIIDQVVKMGHVAQERRVNPKPPVEKWIPANDEAPLLSVATASATKDLAPINETASDDGASSSRRTDVHGMGTAQPEAHTMPGSNGMQVAESGFTCRSIPGTPESTERLCDTTVADGQTSRELTPATSVTEVSNVSGMVLPQSDDSDDSLSDITDYTEESLFEAVEALGPGLSNPLVLSIILTFQEDVLRLVLARIHAMLEDGHGTTRHGGGESSGSSRGGSSSAGSFQNQNPASQQNKSQKRRLNDDREGSGEDDGDDRGKRTKPQAEVRSDLELRYSRLACPFFKRYPGGKWKGACNGPGFMTVHRIKEHVYRKHDQPFCQRCHSTFPDENKLETHYRADTPCTRREGPPSHQGITPEQRKRLKSRKRNNRDPNQTEAERWIELYILLFPEVPRDQIPSPYYDLKSCEEVLNPTIAAAFRQFLGEEIPARVARHLDERLRLIPGAESNFVQAQLPDIIRDSVQEALDNVPSQLLARNETTPLPEAHMDQPAVTSHAADSHNTAQVGAQFVSSESRQETSSTRGQNMPQVPWPNNPEPWVPPHGHLSSVFTDTYFPDPLAGNFDGPVPLPLETDTGRFVPAATAFNTTGLPSAMLSGTPLLSPTLPEMSFGEFNFTDDSTTGFRGTLGSLANTPFVFTTDEKSSNGNATGHHLDHYVPY